MTIAHRRGKWRRNWTYWHFGADVYPDGYARTWIKEHRAHGYVTIPPVNDDLNSRLEPWDGHSQGHCGEHISIFGTARAAVSLAFRRRLREALARQDGTCHGRFSKHEGDIDGVTVYDAGFMVVRRRGEKAIRKFACYNHWEHDFGTPTEWRKVQDDPVGYNRSRSCQRCIVWKVEFSNHAGDFVLT